MEINTLGSVLKYYRIKYNLGQDKICSGICSMATLSKVEHGSRIIDSLHAECLLGRIGKEVLQFEIISNEEDYYLWKLREEILKFEKEKNYLKAQEVLQDYENAMPQNDAIHTQFCLYHKAKVKLAAQKPDEEIIRLLYESLKYTKPEMDVEDEKDLLYNPTEIELMLLLIRYEYPGWMNRNKENELLKMLNHVRKVYTGRQFEETAVQIMLELIYLELQLEDYVRAIQYVDEAVDIISQGRGIEYLAELHFIKARAMEAIYHGRGDWVQYEKQCKNECLMAYYVFDIMGKEEIKEVQKFCEDKLKWQITE